MSITWNFDTNEYEEVSFKPIPVGDHRVRIQSAEEQTSKTGKQMIKVVLDVSGYNSSIWHWIVFDPSNSKLTNQKLGELFNSFEIQPGNFNLSSWVGKVGAAKVKHEDYEGQPSPKIAYFIGKEKQIKLPAWQEPNNSNKVNSNDGFTPIAEDEDLPWL